MAPLEEVSEVLAQSSAPSLFSDRIGPVFFGPERLTTNAP